MSNLTLQINSLEALERLIGNNNDCEITIRNRVVQDFAKKHLKAVANDAVFTKVIDEFRIQLQKEVDKKMEESIAFVKRYNGGMVEKINVHPDIIKSIERVVREKIDGQIAEAVEGGIKVWSQETSLEKRISERMDYFVTHHIDQAVRKRLKDVAGKLIS